MENLKETTEFVDAGFNTVSQAIESFRDGVQLEDSQDFVDEIFSWPTAIRGVKEGFPNEARETTVDQVDALFLKQRQKLITAGLNPMLALTIESATKSVYGTYAAIIQAGENVVLPSE
jgi:hypothetical protein